MDAAGARKSPISAKLRIENVAMREDGKSQGPPEKVIHTKAKNGGG